MKTKNAFLILSNKLDDKVKELYDNVFVGIHKNDKCILLYHDTELEDSTKLMDYLNFKFTDEMLASLGYNRIGNSLLPGNNHFPLLAFYLQNPDYDNYWLIENDVYFHGYWKQFFDTFQNDKSDYISAHIKYFAEVPFWNWWGTLEHPTKKISINSRLKAFNPIYRLSQRGIKLIHIALKDQWKGHHEVLIPSLLLNEGYVITDFGGSGKFVPVDLKNKFYFEPISSPEGWLTTGTFRWRPPIAKEEYVIGKLHHPVKDLNFSR